MSEIETVEKGVSVADAPFLKVSDMSKVSSHGDSSPILDGISFEFSKKGVHGILAPHASGKTALMDVLSGTSLADGGCVMLGDRTVSSADGETVRRIGYVQQSCCLYPDMTASEILDFVGEARRVDTDKRYRQIKEALELVGLTDAHRRLVRRLTSHEQKLLSIAAALIGNPDILLIDEPTVVGATSEERAQICELIRMLGKMKTVVIATPDYSLARELCEDVVILSDGKMIGCGSFELLERRSAERDGSSLESLYTSLIEASIYVPNREETEE